MRFLFSLVGICCALAFWTGPVVEAADSPANGFLDAANWEGIPEYWSVKDGVITGKTPPDLKFNTFLCSKKKYGDFELHFQVRLKDAKGNSGVQIRSHMVDAKRFVVRGPQADMATGYWGSLYGEGSGMMQKAPDDVVKRAAKPADFNDYYVKCVGKHCTIKLNGEVTVDADFPTMPDEGIIAWQLHGNLGEMEVTFKDVRFTDLSQKK